MSQFGFFRIFRSRVESADVEVDERHTWKKDVAWWGFSRGYIDGDGEQSRTLSACVLRMSSLQWCFILKHFRELFVIFCLVTGL
jgi:hypothetical protein